jgi:putative CocE/NonD family hydrolase
VTVQTALPHAVRRIEHCWIPLRDGCRLAARLWLPAGAAATPVPAVLEYIPYRKRDLTRARDEPMHHWFAGHGYAAVRVDVRGSGDSDGVLLDEYTEQEIADGVEVIAWIAAQPWCSGAVGMIGKSWGGFNALQIAARRPAALGAIVSVCASDDRYTDDAHWMGGCLLNENLTWGSVLMTFAALPPDPAVVGDAWRETWRARLASAVFFPEVWLRHPRRDAYWRHGSVAEEPGAIACPVLAVGGWADGYTNAIPRLLATLRAPRAALVGPWGHEYPHDGAPGPAIGFLQEALRWWNRWLADTAPGADEPAYRVWMSGDGGGRWVAEDAWPSSRIATRRWTLAPGRLVDDGTAADVRLEWRSPETVGAAAGEWCSFGLGDLPGDQRADDAGSLVFDSGPLAAGFEILGAPVVVLDVAVDRPRAFVVARLNEVRPDGASVRVTYGVLDLAHRGGHAEPAPLAPGTRQTVRLRLNDVAHAFGAGNRLRLALSTSYWPVVWPSPEPVTLSVSTATSALELPVRPRRPADDALRPFAAPETGPPAPYTEHAPARFERTVARDAATGELVHTIASDGGGFGAAGPGRLDDIDLEVAHSTVRRYRIRDGDPLSARAEVFQTTTLRRGNWAVRVEVRARCAATREAFVLEGTVRAFEGTEEVAARRWDASVPRDGL